MVKALKVTIIVYSVIGILFGLTMIFIPEQMVGGSTIQSLPTLRSF